VVLVRLICLDKVRNDGTDIIDSLSGCFLDALKDQRAVYLEPVLESLHGLGVKMVVSGVKEDIPVAMSGLGP
jgi:hypothetical protein